MNLLELFCLSMISARRLFASGSARCWSVVGRRRQWETQLSLSERIYADE